MVVPFAEIKTVGGEACLELVESRLFTCSIAVQLDVQVQSLGWD